MTRTYEAPVTLQNCCSAASRCLSAADLDLADLDYGRKACQRRGSSSSHGAHHLEEIGKFDETEYRDYDDS